MAMKELPPLLNLVKTISRGTGMKEHLPANIKATAWEDNNGACKLAELKPGQYTLQSKHYAVKMHWFREHLKPNEIVIERIDSAANMSDIFTKPLKGPLFLALRKLLIGE